MTIVRTPARKFVACRASAPAVYLTSDLGTAEDRAATFRVTGDWIAWRQQQYDKDVDITVSGCNARTRHGFRHEVTSAANVPAVKDLAVTAYGAVVFSVVDAFGTRTPQVRAVDARGPRTLAHGGDVDPSSLAVGSTTASWTQAGVRKHAALAKRPAPGTKCRRWQP